MNHWREIQSWHNETRTIHRATAVNVVRVQTVFSNLEPNLQCPGPISDMQNGHQCNANVGSCYSIGVTSTTSHIRH